MATPFSEHLTKARIGAGYKTAYQFFYGNGGTQTLKITYRNYLLMEQGKLFPSVERLKWLIMALKLIPQSTEANVLVVKWLKTLTGEKDYAYLFGSMTDIFRNGFRA